MPKFYCGATSAVLLYLNCIMWHCAVTAALYNCVISALPNANNVTQLLR